jgi:RNA polymerase sigma-70 factor (ECF subfamily)
MERDAQLRAFEQHRPALFARAFRMLGSAMDADDMVQEAFLRWQRTPADRPRSSRAFLLTTVTRLCLDELRSARAQRETSAGDWLAHASDKGAADDPVAVSDRDEVVAHAFLLLLERLTPQERAALILRDVFAYSYDEVAALTGTSTANARQLAHRARVRIVDARPRFTASSAQAERAARLFLRAATTGVVDELVALLASDATRWSDGHSAVSRSASPLERTR